MTTREKYKVLMVCSHPVQYAAPLFRLLAKHPRLETQVAYCSLQGAEPGLDPGFGFEIAWDIPLLDGYVWILAPNRSPRPGLERFWGLLNPSLWKLVGKGRYDAVVAYTGYAYASFWIVAATAKLRGIPFLFGTDATSLQPRDKRYWKLWVKKLLLPAIFRLATVAIVPSTASGRFLRSLGIPESRIVLTPFVADNDWWRLQAGRVDRGAVRRRWGIGEDAIVLLFCAKLQPWKRPQDALQAFAKANVSNSYLVFAGEGPLRSALEAEARLLGVAERIRFLGFVNQSGLGFVYRAADLFVLPSEYDPCPVVVCEAMLCGCPVVLSDAIPGRFDLVQHDQTGFVYPCADVGALAKILRDALADRDKLAELGKAAAERMNTWSPQDNVERLLEAVERACAGGT